MKRYQIRIDDMNLRDFDVRGGHSSSISGGVPVVPEKSIWKILAVIVFLICTLIGFCVPFVIGY